MLSFKESCNIIILKEPHLNTAPGPILYPMHFCILHNYCFLLLSRFCMENINTYFRSVISVLTISIGWINLETLLNASHCETAYSI